MPVNKIELYKALLEIVHQYSIGNGPLHKYKEQNDKIIAMTKENPNLFRYLGAGEEQIKRAKKLLEESDKALKFLDYIIEKEKLERKH